MMDELGPDRCCHVPQGVEQRPPEGVQDRGQGVRFRVGGAADGMADLVGVSSARRTPGRCPAILAPGRLLPTAHAGGRFEVSGGASIGELGPGRLQGISRVRRGCHRRGGRPVPDWCGGSTPPASLQARRPPGIRLQCDRGGRNGRRGCGRQGHAPSSAGVPSCSSRRAAGHARCREAIPTPNRTTGERLSGRPGRKCRTHRGAGDSWSKHVGGDPGQPVKTPGVNEARAGEPSAVGPVPPRHPSIMSGRYGSARARASRLG